MPVLAAPPCLVDEPPFCTHLAGYGLSIGHLRLADIGPHPKLAPHPVYQHFQVQLSHPRDECLARLLIHPHLEGGILLREFSQGIGHSGLISLRPGLDGYGDDWLGKVDGFQDHWPLGVAHRLAGEGIFESQHRCYVSGVYGFDILPVVGVHAHQPPHPLHPSLGGVQYSVSASQGTGVHSQIGQTPNVGIRRDFKDQSGQGFRRIYPAGHLLFRVGVPPHDRRYFQG